MKIPFAALVALTLVACGGSTDENSAAGGSAGQSSGGSGGTGGSGGSAGSSLGGAAGTSGSGGLGGWGPAGEHGVTKIAVGYATWGPVPTAASVFFGVSEQITSGKQFIHRLDKATGTGNVVAEYPENGSSHAVTEASVIVAGHGQVIEGPPPDGWLRSIDVATGASTELATFPNATPGGLVVKDEQLWFVVDGMLSRMPVLGGAVETLTAIPTGAPFAASATRIYLTTQSGISAYDTGSASIVPLATWADAWSDQKLRGG